MIVRIPFPGPDIHLSLSAADFVNARLVVSLLAMLAGLWIKLGPALWRKSRLYRWLYEAPRGRWLSNALVLPLRLFIYWPLRLAVLLAWGILIQLPLAVLRFLLFIGWIWLRYGPAHAWGRIQLGWYYGRTYVQLAGSILYVIWAWLLSSILRPATLLEVPVYYGVHSDARGETIYDFFVLSNARIVILLRGPRILGLRTLAEPPAEPLPPLPRIGASATPTLTLIPTTSTTPTIQHQPSQPREASDRPEIEGEC